MVGHFFGGSGFCYCFEFFYAFADCCFLLMYVDYAWVVFVYGYFDEVYVVGEDDSLVLDGCF